MPPRAILDPILVDVRTEDRPHLKVPARMFRRIDLNGDGIADWIADFSKSGENGFCGTGGCRLDIYVSQSGSAFAKAFDEQVRSFKVTPSSHGIRLDIDVHGSFCGTFGASLCELSYRWDQQEARFTEIANVHGATRIEPAVLLSINPPAPAAVEAVKAELIDVCAKAIGKPPSDPPTGGFVPDLNGDGVRDWVVMGPYCHGDNADDSVDTGTVVVVSSPTGFKRAITLKPGGYGIDIVSRPARLIELLGSSCGFGMVCAERVLVWNSNTDSFVTWGHPTAGATGP